MLDIVLLATMFLVCGGIGLPLAECLPARFAGRVLVAPTLGFAVLATAVPVAYHWGAPLLALLIAGAIAAAACLAWWARRIARRGGGGERRIAIALAAGWLGVLIVLMLPRWFGGEQFSVFQGNMWDAFGYLQSAVVYAHKPYAVIHGATTAELIKNPLYALAQAQLDERPSVHLLYATLSWIAPSQSYRLYYPFLVGCMSQFMLVAVFVVRAALPRASPVVWLAAAAVFPLGFWGQYAFDLNAWSQIASAPILFLVFGLVLRAAIDPPARGEDLRIAGVLAVAVAGALHLYPEGFLMYAAVLGPFAVALPVARMIRARRFALRPLLPAAGFAGAAAIALYMPLVEFLANQVTRSAGTRVWWWTYFQAFFYGRDGALDNPIDFIAGLFGLYFATPPAGAAPVIAAALRIAIVAGVVAVIAALAVVRERELAWASRAMLIGWSAVAVLLVLPAAYLFHAGNYWPAGKIVSYASPVFMTLLATPIAFSFAHRGLRPLRWLAVGFVGFQLALGIARIPAARAADGIHYAPPYPSVTLPRFKQELGWDLAGLDAQLNRSQRVLVQPMDPWAEAYLMMYLHTHRMRYAKATPVNSYFGAGRDLGQMPIGTPDVEITSERAALVLHFRDGRPDVRVRSRPD